jgi:hypothetical protein
VRVSFKPKQKKQLEYGRFKERKGITTATEDKMDVPKDFGTNLQGKL